MTSPAFGEVTVQQRALERALAEGDVADVATSAERLRIALRNVAPANCSRSGPRSRISSLALTPSSIGAAAEMTTCRRCRSR